MQQQQQAHAMQQHTRRRRRRRRADGLASHLLDWANQRVEMALPALELAGWGQASLFRRRYGIDGESLRRFLPGEESERERAIITEATDTANQGRGCGVRSSSKSGCWIAPCRSGVFSVGTWRRRSSRLGVPSSFPLPGSSPRDGKQADFSRRIHPDGDFQGAIRTAHGAAWSSVSISDNGGCRRRSAPRHVTGLSHRSRGIQSAIYPRYLGEQQAGAGKCHRRGCAEGRRGVVCPRARCEKEGGGGARGEGRGGGSVVCRACWSRGGFEWVVCKR